MRRHATAVVRHVIAVGPHAGAHRVALRAAACLALPLVTLVALGRTDLSLYVAFGAFAGIYGRDDVYARRVAMQAGAGLTLVLAMLIGTAVSVVEAPQWARVVAVSAVGAVVVLVADRLRWRPPGSLFAVFATGACASIPATSLHFVHVVAWGGAAVAWSLLVTVTLALRRQRVREVFVWDRGAPAPRAVGWVDAGLVGVAGLLAGLLGLVIVGGHWYWANVAAAAALSGPTPHARLARGVQRLLGTLVGVVLAAGLLAVDPPLMAVVAIAIACQGVIELFVMRNYAIAVLFITVIALLMVHLAAPVPVSTLLTDRVLDTLIGVVVGAFFVIGLAALPARREGRQRLDGPRR